MKKAIPFLLLLLMAVSVFFLKRCKQETDVGSKNNSTSKKINRDRGFDRRTSLLEYTHHAKCRMDCRHITQEEIKDIMQNGDINYRKSDVNDLPCPTYAVEGSTADNQKVRVVFAQCNEKTKVVTVIDLKTEWSCDCPGDDKKYQNRN